MSQDIASLKREHAHLRGIIQPMLDRMRSIEEEIAHTALDVRPGDKVICSQGRTHEVQRVWAKHSDGDTFAVRMYAHQIKKDGTYSEAGPQMLSRKWRKA